ncbi:MAG: hypothetical protein POG74_02910 [Acidocella sp.]|nr:hypothetical protein [Acidocella sp.]
MSITAVVSSGQPILEGAIAANSSYGASSTALNVAAAATQYASATGGVLNGAGILNIINEGPTGSTDEGMAMAELIHAVAPGAQIYFYTAFNSEADFANGITTLASLG